MVHRWKHERGLQRGAFRFFNVREDFYTHPAHEGERSFLVIEVPDWVNVIAETGNDEVVLIRQFRAGVGAVRLEIPGGVIEPGEDPAEAAVRELREETGYAGDLPELICVTEPNPALQPNRCYSYLVRNARLAGAMEPDQDEVIEPVLMRADKLESVIRDGEFSHALLLVPLLHYIHRGRRASGGYSA